MAKTEHLFVSSEGDLYDTRVPAWSRKTPLRQSYRRTFQNIQTVANFKATLRAGKFTWPGGYPLFLITSDGAALCFDCARKEARNIMDSINSAAGDGWRVVACDVNYEDSELHCEHCSRQIEPAYSED